MAATVDAGSNSVHLLVGVVRGHRLEPLVDESVFLGLGAAADKRGSLGAEIRRDLVVALAHYADRARVLGATRIAFLGTEPLRRASDASWVVDAVWRECRVPLHVLSHDEEGLLTLLGVTEGRRLTAELVVVDVGGGSSEVVIDAPGRGPITAGLRVGSARLTARHVRHDPPTTEEIDAMLDTARAAAAEAPPANPRDVVIVGGTASNLVRVVPDAVLDRSLTRARIQQAMAALQSESSNLAAARHGVRLERARVLPAGAAIVTAILERYGVERVAVSDAGIREGAILALGRAGRSWRDALPRLAQGWSR